MTAAPPPESPNPFEDPEFAAEMARMGVVHKPGMAAELMDEIAPLLAAEGIRLNDPSQDFSLDEFNAAMGRAVSQRNLSIATPVGDARERTLAFLAEFVRRVAADEQAYAAELLALLQPDETATLPSSGHVIGVALGWLDDMFRDSHLRTLIAAAQPPKWRGAARKVAVDALALAARGTAFDAMGSLLGRHGGQIVQAGAALGVAGVIIAISRRQHVEVSATLEEFVSESQDPFDDQTGEGAGAGSGSAFGIGRPGNSQAAEMADFRLRQAFSLWLAEDDEGEIDDPEQMLEVVAELSYLQSLARSRSLDLADPADFDFVTDLVLELDSDDPSDDVLGPEDAEYLLHTLWSYTRFQLETGYSGGDWNAALSAIDELTDDSDEDFFGDAMLEDVKDILFEIAQENEALELQQRIEALNETSVISAIPSLLEWIGKSRPITGTKGLRRADIEPFAALLGIDARGGSNAQDPFGIERAESAGPLQSLWDSPQLAAWWLALTHLGVLEFTASRVKPGKEAAAFAGGATPLDLAERIVGVVVTQVLLFKFDRLGPLSLGFAKLRCVSLLPYLAGNDPEDDPENEDGPMLAIAQSTVGMLVDLGIAQSTDEGTTIDRSLRGVVAQGILAALGVTKNYEAGNLDR